MRKDSVGGGRCGLGVAGGAAEPARRDETWTGQPAGDSTH